MKEKPIIFSTPMVQALLNTKPNTWPAEPIDPSKPYKWQTRRVVKPQPREIGKGERLIIEAGKLKIVWRGIGELWETENIRNVPYNIGDILWLRETWLKADDGFHYKANATLDSEELRKAYGYKWRPSIFMPRVAARLFPEVKNVRIERLQDISPEDAEAEGVDVRGYDLGPCAKTDDYYTWAYECLWNALNAKRGYPWDKNPWVWVYEFMRVKS